MKKPEICTLQNCDRPANVTGAARGWCQFHYRVWQSSGDPLITADGRPSEVLLLCQRCQSRPKSLGKGRMICDYCRTHCASCEKELSVGEKHSCNLCAAGRAREWYAENRDRALSQRRDWYYANPDEVFRQRLKKHHITPDVYFSFLQQQSNGCAICHTANPGTKGRFFHVDHDHSCCPGSWSCGLCVRGLLCDKCNPGLGQFLDDPTLLRAAANYVELHQTNHQEKVA